MADCGVYLITCLPNGKVYCGNSGAISRRWDYHKCNLRSGRHFCKDMQADFEQHGEAAFTFAVFATEGDRDKRYKLEAEMIDELTRKGLAYNGHAGRPKTPCSKCGGMERNANGNCVPCYRVYMREYRKKWVAERRVKK